MPIKIICALLILLMSLAGCGQNKVSRCPTAKLCSSGHEGLHPSSPKLCSGGPEGSQSFPSAPLQVCSPAANLHTKDDEEEEVNEPVKSVVFAADNPPPNVEVESEEDIDSRLYEVEKSDLDTKNTGLLILLLFRHKPEPLRARVITEILVERLRCRAEEILYTFYNDWSSSLLLSHFQGFFASAEEKQTMRRILTDRHTWSGYVSAMIKSGKQDGLVKEIEDQWYDSANLTTICSLMERAGKSKTTLFENVQIRIEELSAEQH